MCKFEFKTYKQKKETVETFEDSVCNGIPKGRRMLKKAFEDNADEVAGLLAHTYDYHK